MHKSLSSFLAVTTGILLLSSVSGLARDEQEDRATAQDRRECMRFLGFTEDQLEIGTFNYRLQDCMEDRVQSRTWQTRLQRMNMRHEKVAERVARNSKAYIWERVDAEEDVVNIPTMQGVAKQGILRPARRHIRAAALKNQQTGNNAAQEFKAARAAAAEKCKRVLDWVERMQCISDQLE